MAGGAVVRRIPAWLREWIKRLRASVARRPVFAAALLSLLAASPARADTPTETRGNWRYGISVAAAVTAVDLRSGKVYSAGINAAPALGACLGVTYLPWDLGADGCGNYQVNQDKPNQLFGSLMLHWKSWVNGGFGLLFTQGESLSPLLLLGGRLGVYEGTTTKEPPR
jgi:hypothetical protein